MVLKGSPTYWKHNQFGSTGKNCKMIKVSEIVYNQLKILRDEWNTYSECVVSFNDVIGNLLDSKRAMSRNDFALDKIRYIVNNLDDLNKTFG